MKLCTFRKGEEQLLGVHTAQGIVDVASALTLFPRDHVPYTMMEVIEEGSASLSILQQYVDQLDLSPDKEYVLDEKDIDWEPAITQPNKIICIGLNYRAHADETKAPYPETPILFSKFNNALTGHQREIVIPSVTEKVDYEAELGMVIGKKAKNISPEKALDYVFGYCVANDVSARDLQLKTSQWLLGKTGDDFCPIGPYVVTADEVGDPQQLDLKTTVNGEVRQDSNTSDMIFSCQEIVSYISQHMTLLPGDLILTGTPSGVVLGYPKHKRVYLQPGDEVTVEIDKLGKLTNTFVEDK